MLIQQSFLLEVNTQPRLLSIALKEMSPVMMSRLNQKVKKTGKGISLKGKTVNVNCPEVCDFRGYEFKNGVYTYYFVAGQANKWKINVFEKDKVISTDSGTLE